VSGIRYASGTRRVTAPSRFRPIGYRAGGPSPQPGPNPSAPNPPAAPPTPQPTPNPQPGPAPPATTPVGPPGPDLGAAITAALGDVQAAGQVLLGAALVAVALVLLMGDTALGRGAVKRGLRAIPGVGALS
jgi:hypothetical protein